MLEKYMFHVDAFANGLFSGNPACVCILEKWCDDDLMQSIANENNLAETAFAVPLEKGNFHLRWFTPASEVKLCGHATLATAHILFNEYKLDDDLIRFQTLSGELQVRRRESYEYILDFPTDFPKATSAFDDQINLCIDVKYQAVKEGDSDLLVVLENEEALLNLKINLQAMSEIEKRGVVFTAQGSKVDFVSRCFYPAYGIDEDPATGSAHTLLTPYWAVRLKKNVLKAEQLSQRVGYFDCVFKGDTVSLLGKGFTFKKSCFTSYFENKIFLKAI